eukprot:g2971.t1
MHALFKLNKQKKKQKPEAEEDLWSDDSNSSDEFWDTDDQNDVNDKFVKSISMNDSNALNLNYVNRRRRVRVYEGDLQPLLATYLEEQDKLIPAGERYRNNTIESNVDSPRGNISPIRRATRIHSRNRRKQQNGLQGKKSSQQQSNGDGRLSPSLHRHLGSVGLIANWHQKTMRKIEGVQAFGKSYLTSLKEKEREEEIKAKALEKSIVNDLLHVSRKKKNLRRRTEYLLSQHPEKQFIKEKSDLQIKSAKILACGSRRDKKAILKLRRFRIQQSVKG